MTMNSVALVLTGLLVAAPACARPAAPVCYDCGPCGMTGPGVDGLYLDGAGVAADGERGIIVKVASRAGCAGAGVRRVLTWDGSAMTERPGALGVETWTGSRMVVDQPRTFVDDPTARKNAGQSYTWTSPALTIGFASVPGAQTGTATVDDQGKTTVLQCRAVDNVVTCVR